MSERLHPIELTGLIPSDVGDALTFLASTVREGVIVEIGSFRGKSAAYLALGVEEGSANRVYAVDPWDLQSAPGKHGYNATEVRLDFVNQIAAAGFSDIVHPIRGYSVEVAASWATGVEIEGETWRAAPPIGMLYLDGDHTAEAISDDFMAWYPFLTDRAIIAFDDLDTKRNPGVREVFDWARDSLSSPIAGRYRFAGVLADRLGVIAL